MSELTARQYSVKAIHEDKLNLGNPSILAKLLKDYASIKCKEQKQLCADQFMDRNRDYTIMTTGDFGDLCVNAPEPKI